MLFTYLTYGLGLFALVAVAIFGYFFLGLWKQSRDVERYKREAERQQQQQQSYANKKMPKFNSSVAMCDACRDKLIRYKKKVPRRATPCPHVLEAATAAS